MMSVAIRVLRSFGCHNAHYLVGVYARFGADLHVLSLLTLLVFRCGLLLGYL